MSFGEAADMQVDSNVTVCNSLLKATAATGRPSTVDISSDGDGGLELNGWCSGSNPPPMTVLCCHTRPKR
jgi:hypothetical protein